MKKLWKWLIIVGVIILVLAVLAVAFVLYENGGEGMVVKKPAIYLYPIHDSFINVHLNINGQIINDMPDYNNGWKVFVTKEGVIEGDYDYLFYEAKLNKLDLPDEGWIVNSEDLDYWFNTNLKKLGLNEKESVQFKEYWLSELPNLKYYEIKLLNKEFLDNNMGLIVNPEPDTLIRVNLYFKPIKEMVYIEEPNISTPVRQGFTVVEWGGILEPLRKNPHCFSNE